MPDLFFCHSNDARGLGTDNLLNWNDYFSPSELDKFVPDFLDDGMVDDHLVVFPFPNRRICSSSQAEFSTDSPPTKMFRYLTSKPGKGSSPLPKSITIGRAAKPFCAIDYLIRIAELCAISDGENISYKDGWYDANNPALRNAYEMFATSIAKGHIVVSDLYSNTQVMTGQTCAGIGSSASVLYYNDEITYPDNTSEAINLKSCPCPNRQANKKSPRNRASGFAFIKRPTGKPRLQPSSRGGLPRNSATWTSFFQPDICLSERGLSPKSEIIPFSRTPTKTFTPPSRKPSQPAPL